MVSAQNAASDRATPRIHRLMLEDRTTQSVLASFVGAFVYALTAIILFRTGLYPDEVAVLVMGVTIAVVMLVVVAMLRWIDHLTWLGSLDQSLSIATERARASLLAHARRPALRAVPLTEDVVLPDQLTPVPAATSGYVQIVDVEGIEACLPGVSRAYISRAPGRHVLAGQPLALVSGQVEAADLRAIAGCFVTGHVRPAGRPPGRRRRETARPSGRLSPSRAGAPAASRRRRAWRRSRPAPCARRRRRPRRRSRAP